MSDRRVFTLCPLLLAFALAALLYVRLRSERIMSSDTPLYHQNLDTTFVNLWSLLRKLTQQGFIGRVHVEMQDYAADVFLDGSSTPLVREIDRAANTETIEPGALHRVVLRARETPGVINVFEGVDEARVQPPVTAIADEPPRFDISAPTGPEIFQEILPQQTASEPQSAQLMDEPAPIPVSTHEDVYRSGSYHDWPAILVASGELIAAVERGVNATGGDFASLFNAVRLELADDYLFLDPIAQTLRYADGVASLRKEPDVKVFVAGLGEALRRTVNAVAVGDRARRVRERVALEMLSVVRRRRDTIDKSGLRAQLDRIAGTTVL
jgi:hypothetical protein